MIQCNDYELLYLMNEFDEEAERILVERYLSVIKYRIKTFKIKTRYIEDFIQEGLFLFYNAVRIYDQTSNKTFFRYYDMILRRKFVKLIEKEKNYFYDVDLMSDLNMLKEPSVFEYEKYDEVKVSLSVFEKTVLEFVNKNYKPKEIANILECDVKSVYNCLCRIKSKKY